MNSIEYMKNVKRTESPNFSVSNKRFSVSNKRLVHGAIGCCTEAGEIMDIIKKSLFYSRGIKKWDLVEEIGDMLWYIGILCDELEISFEEIMDMNIKKLKERYSKQFTKKDEQIGIIKKKKKQ